MKSFSLLFFLIVSLSAVKAQKVTLVSGNEIELPNREKFVDVLHSDASGAFVFERHYKNINYLFKSEKVGTLYKFDQNCNILFQKTLDVDLSLIKYVNGALYGLDSKYDSKEKKLSLLMCEISATDGSTKYPLKEIASVTYLTKNEDRISWGTINSPQSSFVIYLNQSTDKENNLHIYRVDSKGTVSHSTTSIGSGNDLTVLRRVFIREDKLVAIVNNYDYTKEKRKQKFLKDISINIYSAKGELLNKIPVEVKDKFITATDFNFTDDNNLLATGFYSDEIDVEYNNGFFTALVDLKIGKVVSTDSKPISKLSLGYAKEGDKKATQGTEGNYKFRELAKHPSGDSYVLVAENEWNSDYTSTSAFNTDLSKGYLGTTTRSLFINKSEDIFLVGISKTGKINWVSNVPKRQEERFRASSPSATDFPYFSSLAVIPTVKNLFILFNDDKRNSSITSAGEKPKEADDFDKTVLQVLTVDYTSGKLSRQAVDNAENGSYIYQPKN